ncbi:GNAT family N-acetyltransferase [Peptostreptococcaceae bacterium OttesenSCG-928-C18]|nr:GNAT family N-acetyltransferase [Peptostreptococcaceae bacterium OttesenSCG-928-C18]
MKILLKTPKSEEYINLRKTSGMGGEKSKDRVKVALENSLLNVSVYENEKLIGFGRIVGDKGITYIVSDIMVHKDYQGKGIGKMIMQKIDDYFEDNCNGECYIMLFANKPADKLYSKYRFDYLKEHEVGMKRKNS